MGNKKITELPELGTATANVLVPVVSEGNNFSLQLGGVVDALPVATTARSGLMSADYATRLTGAISPDGMVLTSSLSLGAGLAVSSEDDTLTVKVATDGGVLLDNDGLRLDSAYKYEVLTEEEYELLADKEQKIYFIKEETTA